MQTFLRIVLSRRSDERGLRGQRAGAMRGRGRVVVIELVPIGASRRWKLTTCALVVDLYTRATECKKQSLGWLDKMRQPSLNYLERMRARVVGGW